MTADAALVALIVRHGAGWNGNDFLSRNITILARAGGVPAVGVREVGGRLLATT